MIGPFGRAQVKLPFFHQIRRWRSLIVHAIFHPLVRLMLPLPWTVALAAVWLLGWDGQIAEVIQRMAEEASTPSNGNPRGMWLYCPLVWGVASFLLLSLNILGYYLTNTSNRQSAIYGDVPKLYLDGWLRSMRHGLAFVCATAPLLALTWALITSLATGPAVKLAVGLACASVMIVGIVHVVYHRSIRAAWVAYYAQIASFGGLVVIAALSAHYQPDTMVRFTRWLGPLTMTALQLLAGFATLAIVLQYARQWCRALFDILTIWAGAAVLTLVVAVSFSGLRSLQTRMWPPAPTASATGKTTSPGQADQSAPKAAQPDARQALATWMAARTDKLDLREHSATTLNYPVYIVAAEGGGIYAATAVASFLGHMREQHPAFANHLFAVTGVSGGAVGAAVHSLATPSDDRAACNRGRGEQATAGAAQCDALAILGQDHLSPVLSMVMPDLLLTFARDVVQTAFYPFLLAGKVAGVIHAPTTLSTTVWGQRACLLEASLAQESYGPRECDDVPKSGGPTSIANHWGGGLRQHALLLTTTKKETGEPVVFSPFPFADGARIRSIDADGVNPGQVSVIKAAVASARFPLVLPPYVVHTEQATFNFVDGGYADNSGAGIAGRMLSHLKGVSIAAPTKDDVTLRADIKIVLITSDDGRRTARPSFGSKLFVDFLVPFETLFNVRSRIGPSEVADLIDSISDRVSTIGYGESHAFLGWAISARTLGWVRHEVTGQAPGACPADSRSHPSCNRDKIDAIVKSLGNWIKPKLIPTADGG